MSTWDKLEAIHLDALQEVGNIGAGNAATALAALLNKRIQMKIPRAGVVSLKEIPALVGNEEEPVACVEFSVSGSAPSKILFMLNEKAAFALIDILLGQEQGTTTSLDEMGCSILQEVSNILTGNFLNAFAELCNLHFVSSVPAFAFDMLVAVLTSALLEGGYFSDRIMVIETEFYTDAAAISGHFFLIPYNDSLVKILNALGLKIE
ncbi:MAG: CheY-P-specific phosphatase CheC [Clostridia bacterium]|nr:CheY-P-specific phosphatase CheC [Clostridia bacterium]